MKWRYLLALVLVALGLVLARESLRARGESGAGDGSGAAWIWSAPRGQTGAPIAMFAAKDFELPFVPVEAEIEIAADEEYQLMINGRGLAAGRYREWLDAYPVGGILRGGTNRIVVELRSARGVGGLYLRLHIRGPEGETATVVSDGSWRVMHQFVAGFSQPGFGVWGEPVKVWGPPPAGRWRAASTVRPALTLLRLQGGKRRRPRPAARIQRLGERWQRAEAFNTEPLGPWVTFDFGRERVGFVNLRFADAEKSNAFLYYGLRRPQAGLEHPDAVIIRPRGRDHWTSAAPATFRFVTVVGAPSVTAGELVQVVPELVGDLALRAPPAPLLGVDRQLSLVSPVENEIRRKLEGIPSLAGREEG